MLELSSPLQCGGGTREERGGRKEDEGRVKETMGQRELRKLGGVT